MQYSGLVDEHTAVRNAAGLFDVSHMGELRVSGPGAEDFLQWLTPNDVSKLKPGRAHYSALLTEEGTYRDDLLIYRLAPEEYMLVVNAANVDEDFAWIQGHCDQGVRVEDISSQYALLALQGPKASEILAPLTDVEIGALRYYRFSVGKVAGVTALVSRTGYTGEDGFELYLHSDDALAVWRRLIEAGSPSGLIPAGLGARDTLRLEAGMALYGHEIDDSVTPWEAGLDWTVKIDAGDFIGRKALMDQRLSGVSRRLVGFELKERGIARQGHEIVVGADVVGRVTSGTFSPTFQKALGMAYVPRQLAAEGTPLAISVRGRKIAAQIVKTPFYRRS